MSVDEVALADYKTLTDDDCAAMREQISDYMKIYSELEGADKLLQYISGEEAAEAESKKAIENGKSEESGDSSLWIGRDPRKVLKSSVSGGLLNIVTPDGNVPSGEAVSLTGLPSAACESCAGSRQWEDIDFDDLDMFEAQVDSGDNNSADLLVDNYYGIRYALEFFDAYTDAAEDGRLAYEVEYIICGKDNDYDNLQGVVNMIVLHRLPVNFAYLMTDKAKVSSVSSIAAVLALLPGVTYSATKYLILGCWAYAETLADIRVLLAGNNIQFLKSKDSWLTDINSLGKLANIQAENYEGKDAIDYEDYLAVLLAENAGSMYYRMADVIQLNLSLDEETFAMSNMMYEFSLDMTVVQNRKYAAFIESAGNGQISVDSEVYRHSYRMTTGY